MPALPSSSQRMPLPDLARAFALIGIILVNIQIFAHPLQLTYADAGFQTALDRWAALIITTLFTAKSFALFSFMFGAGLGFQMAAAERAGHKLGPLYRRRMAGLLLLGALHSLFLFVGDILVLYALLGSALYFCRRWSVERLMGTGVMLVFAQAALLYFAGILTWLGASAGPESVQTLEAARLKAAPMIAAYKEGSFLDMAGARLTEWPGVFTGLALTQGLAVFGYFLLGLAAVRAGVVQDHTARLWRLARWRALPFGLVGSGIAAASLAAAPSPFSAQTLFGHAMLFTAAPLLAAGYLGLIANYAGRMRGSFGRWLARAGSASLSVYLLQSLVLSFLFNGYGLGLYYQLGAATCIAIALATSLFTLALIGAWRIWFTRGPAEIWLRQFTYSASTATKTR